MLLSCTDVTGAMAEKQFTLKELQALKTQQLQELAIQLQIPQKGMTKKQLIENIFASEAAYKPLPPETGETSVSGSPETEQSPAGLKIAQGGPKNVVPPQPHYVPPEAGIAQSLSLQLELQKLQFQREREREEWEREEKEREREQKEREREYEREERQKEREHVERLEQLKRATDQQQQTDTGPRQFRVDTAAKMLPKLASEQEIETYLITFEKIATINKWPKEQWSAVLQTQLRGKALKVFAEMPILQSTNFETLSTALLAAYELCPEVYRKKFRTSNKQTNDSYTDFAFKLTVQFKRWLQGLGAYDKLEELRQVFLMEQFMETLPTDTKLWLLDRKPKTLNEMAREADAYVAVRKSVGQSTEQNATEPTTVMFTSRQDRPSRSPPRFPKGFWKQDKQMSTGENRLKQPIKCYYCGKPNHVASECRKRQKDEKDGKPKTFVRTATAKTASTTENTKHNLLIASQNVSPLPVLPLHPLFAPFCKEAAICDSKGKEHTVRILRDTAALQSLLLESSVPSSAYIHTGEVRLLKGISGQPLEVPLVEMHFRTDFLDEKILCGLIKDLPEGVDFLLGNDIWFQGHPLPEVDSVNAVVTRAQTAADRASKALPTDESQNLSELPVNPDELMQYGTLDLSTVTSCEEFRALQENDKGLRELRSSAEVEPYPVGRPYYYMSDGVLMHHMVDEKRNHEANQLVLPSTLRNRILYLAHDIPASGHLGITKTKARLWPHFYWPRMAKDVTRYCRSCDTCQRLGKGRKPPPAPLIPLPIISQPFSRIAIDIVGPLPTCIKSGNRFILTVLDMATHYPEAIALPAHTAMHIAQALSQVFSHFGFPEEILSDQGSDLMSDLMQIFLHDFRITQIKASAYHPQTNGSCERFHRTLKSMIRANAADFPEAWDESLPWLLFAYREIPVETIGFSPFEMLFGRDVRGPLNLVKSGWKPTSLHKTKPNVLQFLLETREKLKTCQELAQEQATQARTKSKVWYDRKARERAYKPQQLVLVLLPAKGKPLDTKYCGPYRVLERIGTVDYLIATPDRRKVQRICHVNMLKPYVEREAKFLQPEGGNTWISTVTSVDNCDNLGTNDFGPSATDVDTGFVLDHLESDRRKQLFQLLTSYRDVFQDRPGRTNLCEHTIELQPNTKPIRVPPYRVNPLKAELIDKEIDLMLEMGVIERSNSPWASPVVLVPKPDGSIRFCSDFRKLNNVTIPDAHPMPRIDDLIDRVGHATYLTKIDLSRGYWQVPLDERSIPVSAFVTPHGHFQWRYMPFGLRNAPATFQRLIWKVLEGLESFTGAYLDDIIIFSSSWSDHIQHIQQVFERIRQAGLTLKRAKCIFGTAELEFLGHKVGLGKVEPRRKTVQALIDFPRPTSQKQIRSYLGLAGYYRRFIPHFADVAASLNKLLKKGVKFAWTEETEKAFVDLKSRLASRPILRPPNFNLPFSVAVDASNTAIGANLFQLVDELEHPVCYFSKKLNIHQQRYSTVEKEAFALLTAVRTFSPYFGSQPVTVFTDHSPLQFVQRMANHNQKLLRWALELQQYNLRIVHRPGKLNLLPDILSRPSN